MSTGGRTQSYPYPHHPVLVTGQTWTPGSWQSTEVDQARRRHPSDSPASHLQHISSYHQWQIQPPSSAVSRRSSSDSLSSQASLSNPRSPTGSTFSSETEYIPPQEYRSNGARIMSDRYPMSSYYSNQQMPHGRSYQGSSNHWSQDVRRRSAADVYSQPELYLKGVMGPQTTGPSHIEGHRGEKLHSSSLMFSHKRSNSFSRGQPQDSGVYIAPGVQHVAYERNIYERVGDVVASPNYQSHKSKSGVELSRAPSSQSISSNGSGSMWSSDYPNYRQRKAGSKENVYYQNPSHLHPHRMQDIHYRQGSNDSGSQYRGDLGNRGNKNGVYQSPDSADSGFVSSDMGTSDQQPVYTEVQRSGYQRPGFSRAQTVPAEVWPERTNRDKFPPLWYDDGEDVDFGNGGSTVPQLGIDMVAGKPNGRYFPFSPPKLSEQDKTSKRIMKKSQSGSTLPSRSPQVQRNRSGTLNKIARKFGSKKPKASDNEEVEEAIHRPRSSSFSFPEDFNSRGRRAQSLERLNDKSPTSPDEGENSSVLATIGTPKMFRSKKMKKVVDNDSVSLSGSISNLFKGDKSSSKKHPPSSGSIDTLFAAVMTQDMDKVQFVLSTEVMDLNSRNEDGFTPLDLAVMMDNPLLAGLLQDHGARDSQQYFKDPTQRIGTLTSLINECEHEITLLMMQSLQAGGYTASTVAKELGKRLQHWEWRRHYFKKMKQFCVSITPPGPPKCVTLSVASSQKLTVAFSPPDGEEDSRTVITRYRIEWSQDEDFSELAGERTTADVRNLEYTIPDLKEGEKYFVRVSACNLAGFGPCVPSTPPSATPSTWHNCAVTKPRYEGSFNSILTLGAHTKNFYTQNSAATILTEISSSPSQNTRQKSIKRGISKFFGNTVKYHKNLKPGLYLALVYHSDDDRILVTADDNIPIVEVGDEYNRGTLGADISWLNRVLCASDLVKTLRDISSTCVTSPNINFRNKLLSVLCDLQSSLGVVDLGQLYPQPYFDAGATVLAIVNQVETLKSLGQSLKWTTLQKFARKRSTSQTPYHVIQIAGSIPDRIAIDIMDLIIYHKRSKEPLPRGLYIGYYQAMSTVGYLKMLGSKNHPNVLPHRAIRSSPNVSREEWEWLTSLGDKERQDNYQPTELVKVFQKQLVSTIKLFVEELALPEEDVKALRLYTSEVIELNEDVSFILLMPSEDMVCMPPGSEEALLNYPNTMSIPIHLFQIVQFNTYQQAFLKMYAQLSARLELELAVSQHKRRQAFTKEEMAMASEAHTCLEQFNERLDGLWHRVTWTDDVLKKGREVDGGTPLQLLFNSFDKKEASQPKIANTPSLNFVKIQPMYNTGLAMGTTVKLNINLGTRVSNVVRQSVLQLDDVRRSRGKQGPNITDEDLSDFYVSVAPSGSKEFIIPNDFLMSQLPSKWPNCQLFLRRHSEYHQTEQGPCTSV